MEIAVKSCKNFEILFACHRIWQKEDKEDANLACTSSVKPIGLRLVISFVQCASDSQNFFHYQTPSMAIKDEEFHIYQKHQYKGLAHLRHFKLNRSLQSAFL